MAAHQPSDAPTVPATVAGDAPADALPYGAVADEDQSGEMPPWTEGELPEPPNIKRGVLAILGPGLMMAGAAIGGGEWLMGPKVTAQYGGMIMWLALAS